MKKPLVTGTVTRGATVTAKTEIELIKEAHERIRNDPEALKRLMRAVMGPPKRVLEGEEREHMLTVFRLLEPVRQTNNQRSFTDEYEHAGKMYDVTYFEDETIVEEYLDEES